MTKILDSIEVVNIDDITPYINNPKKHPKEQIVKIASSIKNFGFTVPIVVDKDLEIIAGHGRYLASKKLGLNNIPIIKRNDLNEAQVNALRIADNRVAESEWDNELLAVELEKLKMEEFDLEMTGFEGEEIEDIINFEENSQVDDEQFYTDKIKSPCYEITGDKPDISDLYDDDRTRELIKKINDSDVSEDKKRFLKLAAYRHIIFDYENIAEFYAHEDKEMQELMEDLTLVIIDFNNAIEQGFVEFAYEVLEREKINER